MSFHLLLGGKKTGSTSHEAWVGLIVVVIVVVEFTVGLTAVVEFIVGLTAVDEFIVGITVVAGFIVVFGIHWQWCIVLFNSKCE